MKFFKWLGFRKADEMDQYISTVALRWSWLVIVLLLLIWSIYGVVAQGEITPPLMVLGAGLAVNYGVILYMRKRLYDHPEE